MNFPDDIATLVEQESQLVFPSFDEDTAFKLGSAIRARAVAEGLGIVVDIRLWDRPLFYCALPRSTGSNPEWARRKANVVKLYQKSTYRMVLEQGRPDRTFPPGHGLNAADYVLAGGGFPIRVNGVGVIGAISVSGLPERDDHGVVVDALCDHLGKDRATLRLPAPNV